MSLSLCVTAGSESLLIKELFQSAMSKTGSISPSARQRVSRKMKPSKSPFDFFKKLRASKQDNRVSTITVRFSVCWSALSTQRVELTIDDRRATICTMSGTKRE